VVEVEIDTELGLAVALQAGEVEVEAAYPAALDTIEVKCPKIARARAWRSARPIGLPFSSAMGPSMSPRHETVTSVAGANGRAGVMRTPPERNLAKITGLRRPSPVGFVHGEC
jgi:hypothetical protein